MVSKQGRKCLKGQQRQQRAEVKPAGREEETRPVETADDSDSREKKKKK